jgi:hypothetical protein
MIRVIEQVLEQIRFHVEGKDVVVVKKKKTVDFEVVRRMKKSSTQITPCIRMPLPTPVRHRTLRK